MSQPVIVGSFEVVSLPELELYDVVAKIDTGAYSGAIHCTDIALSDDKTELCFNPAGAHTSVIRTTDFIKRRVRSSNGQQILRYLIKTAIILNGVSYQTEIGLSDRSDMKHQVLIGRRFLRQQHMLVDVIRNSDYDEERELDT